MPTNSENSYLSAFLTQITPFLESPALLVKNILYCVFSGITTLSKSATVVSSTNLCCIADEIVPNATSPNFSVPAIVRNPSGPKNI